MGPFPDVSMRFDSPLYFIVTCVEVLDSRQDLQKSLGVADLFP